MNAIERVLADAGEFVDDRLNANPAAKAEAMALLAAGRQPFCATVSKQIPGVLIGVAIKNQYPES